MKTSLRLTIIVFIYSLCFSPIKAQDNFRVQKDSLLAIIPELEGEAKLKAYQNLIHFPYTPEQSDTLFFYLQQSIIEAQKQENIKYEMTFKLNELVFSFNHNRNDIFWEKINTHLDFFHKNKSWANYFLSGSLLVEASVKMNNYDNALEVARNMYDKSKEIDNLEGQTAATYSIAQTYFRMSRNEDAEKYFRETILLGKEKAELNQYVRRAYANMSANLISQERFDEALELLGELRGEIEKLEREGIGANNLQNNWSLYYTRLIAVYLEMGDLDKAEHYCDVLEEKIAGNNNVMMLYNLYVNRADIYESRGTYQKALEAIDKTIGYAASFLEKAQMNDCLIKKARILCKMGKGDEGYLLYDELLAYKDSTNMVEINAKLDELRTIYEVDKITAEKEISRQRLFIVTGICFFLIIVAGIYIIYARRLKVKNNALYEQIKELTRIEKTAEEYLINTAEEKLSDSMLLFRRISKCVKSEKLFADPDISRKKLADLLNSNETYIADAIRESTGETYSSYISNQRLQYALNLLHSQPLLTLDAVAIDSGHGSYSSFYRLFTKKYGITPSEYRKLSESKEVR